MPSSPTTLFSFLAVKSLHTARASASFALSSVDFIGRITLLSTACEIEIAPLAQAQKVRYFSPRCFPVPVVDSRRLDSHDNLAPFACTGWPTLRVPQQRKTLPALCKLALRPALLQQRRRSLWERWLRAFGSWRTMMVSSCGGSGSSLASLSVCQQMEQELKNRRLFAFSTATDPWKRFPCVQPRRWSADGCALCLTLRFRALVLLGSSSPFC